MTTTYTVSGMTCQHCVHAVTTEVSSVAGVDSVEIDLASGTVTVNGNSFTDDQIAAAVEEAGYTLVTQ